MESRFSYWGLFRRHRSQYSALLAAAHDDACVPGRWELDRKGEWYQFLVFVSVCVLTMPIESFIKVIITKKHVYAYI